MHAWASGKGKDPELLTEAACDVGWKSSRREWSLLIRKWEFHFWEKGWYSEMEHGSAAGLPGERPGAVSHPATPFLPHPLSLAGQSCLTLYTPLCCSPPGCSVHGILQQEHWSRLPSLQSDRPCHVHPPLIGPLNAQHMKSKSIKELWGDEIQNQWR